LENRFSRAANSYVERCVEFVIVRVGSTAHKGSYFNMLFITLGFRLLNFKIISNVIFFKNTKTPITISKIH